MITGKQCRAARALLGWNLDDLAQESGIAKNSIANLEKNATSARQSSLEALYKAFSKNNIEFIGKTGVKEKEDTVELFYGADNIQKLWDNIINTLENHGGEVLITNVDEQRTLNIVQDDLYAHVNNLKNLKITERLLSREGDTHFIMPKECYRWVSEEVFSSGTSTYIYKNKVAYQLWGDDVIVLIHSEKAYDAEKSRFEYMWGHAKLPK